MTRLTVGGLTVLAGAMLAASEATAAPLVLRCEGVAIYVSPYEPTPTRVATQRYYRIDQRQFSRLSPSDVVRSGNLCTTKAAECSIDQAAFSVTWKKWPSSIRINHKSGRVLDSAPGVDFTGDCLPSTDPAKLDEPNKF